MNYELWMMNCGINSQSLEKLEINDATPKALLKFKRRKISK